jgi:3-oxoadipate enol-lactonase
MRDSGNDIKITVNDLTISYTDEGLDKSAVIIFIHGFPFNKSMWKQQVEAFKENYRVIAYDVRGHGTPMPGLLIFQLICLQMIL